MVERSVGDDSELDWNTDDEIDNYQSSPPLYSTSVIPIATNLAEMGSSDDEIDNYQSSPLVHSTTVRPISTNLAEMGSSDEMVARFIEMGFSIEMIARAFKETNRANSEPDLILETLFKYNTSSEASSLKSKVIDTLITMGFSEASVIKAVHEYGEENVDEITNALLSYQEADKLCEADNNVDIINFNLPLDSNDDDSLYSGLFCSDEENEVSSSREDSRLQDLINMEYSRQEASIAIERCGEDASVAELIDFICAAQMARQFDEFYAEEEEPRNNKKKRRVYIELPRRGRPPNTAMASDDDLIRLPNPMIGFGLPNKPGLLMQRPVPIPYLARAPPYFYYENVAMAPKGVWDKISSHLYGIKPEFVDSQYFSAAARKRGYIHNLPINNRYQILPLPYTKPFPRHKDGSAQLTKRIRIELEKHDGMPPDRVQKAVMKQCRKWNLVWVGKNKLAPLEADEMEKLLGFPTDHTRGGGVGRTERYKSLGNSFQVDTVAYHLSVLKPLFPNGINVLSLSRALAVRKLHFIVFRFG